jgi:cytoskeletal protein CcmA (bactofilin family)
MKRFVLLLTVLLCGTVRAFNFVSTDAYEVKPEGQLIEESWIAAQEVVMAGDCRKDLFTAAGTNAVLSGRFSGDVWCTSARVELSGRFNGDVRVAANKSVVISGTVNGNLMVFAPTIKITSGAVLNGHLYLAGQHIISEGTLNNRTALRAGKVTLGGTFNGPSDLQAGKITILPGTVFNEDVTYLSGKELLPGSRVTFNGDLTRAAPPEPEPTDWGARMYRQAGFLLAALLTGLAFINLFPHYAVRSTALLQLMPWRCVLTGLAAFFVVPVLAAVLLLSLAGLPLALILAGFFVTLAYLGRMVTALMIGLILLRTRTLPDRRRRFGALALGLVLFYLLSAIPALSFGLWSAVTMAGTGALIHGLFQRTSPTIEPPNLPEETVPENHNHEEDPS